MVKELLYRNATVGGENTYIEEGDFPKLIKEFREILEGCWNEAIESRNYNEFLGNVDWNEIKEDKQTYLDETTRF